ncbi:MAG: ATP-dependent metallopeptidase FtsH/Yme1/Tma family protein [Elusimicrobiota bacterium]
MTKASAFARVVSSCVAAALLIAAPGLPAYAAAATIVLPVSPLSAAPAAAASAVAAPALSFDAAAAAPLGSVLSLPALAAAPAAIPAPAAALAAAAAPALGAPAAAERPSALDSARAAAPSDQSRPAPSGETVFDGAVSAAADGPEIDGPRAPAGRTRVTFTLSLDAKKETVQSALNRLRLYYGFSAEAVPTPVDGKALVTGSVPVSTFLSLARAPGVLDFKALPGAPAPVNGSPSGLGGARVVMAAAPAERPAPFVAATRLVAELELLAKENPAKAQAQAIAYLEGRRETRREVRLAALDVLDARPLADVLPFYRKTLALFAETRVQKAKADGSDAIFYIQRAILNRLASESAAVKADAALLALMKTSYADRNPSVRLAAAKALRAAGVDPGPENEYLPATTSIVLTRVAVDPNGIPGVDEPNRVGTNPAAKSAAPAVKKSFLSRWKYSLIALAVAASLGLGALYYRSTHASVEPSATAAYSSQAGPAGSRYSGLPFMRALPGSDETTVQVEAPKEPTDKQLLQQIANSSERLADAQERTARALEAQAAAQKAAQLAAQQSAFRGILMSIGMMVLSALIFIGLFAFLPKIFKSLGRASNGGMSADTEAKTFTDKPTQRLSDVEGIDESLVEVQEILDAQRDVARYLRMGAKAPKGLLLEGPPGTGKTLLARALAGETNSAFFSVSGSDFIELFVGMGARRVRELIEAAAGHKPAIVFIDEIDAVGKARGNGGIGGGGESEREQTINALLTGMDGFDNSGGIIFVAATNRADTLDPALLRPGRFDRRIFVGKPHMGGRKAIATLYSADKRLSPDLDLGFVARRTAGLAGADIKNIMNEAALQAIRRGADAIETQDVDEAIDRGTIGAKRNLPMPEKLKKRVAYHEAGHVLANMLNENVEVRQKVTKFTIVPHGSAALGFAEMAPEEGDKYLYELEELEARIDHALGGMIAEKMIFGKTQEIPEEYSPHRRPEWSTGPGSDLESATNVAREMVQRLGMGEKTGLAVTAPDQRDPYGRSPFGDIVAAKTWVEVNKILEASYARVTARLKRNRHVLEALAQAVLKKETLIGEEIEKLVADAVPVPPPPAPKR